MTSEIEFDPHDPTFVEVGVPFDVLARIRSEQPVFRTPGGAHYLSRYADVEAALKDVDVFWAELGPITGIPAGVATIPADQHYLSEIPEPRHGEVRRQQMESVCRSRSVLFQPLGGRVIELEAAELAMVVAQPPTERVVAGPDHHELLDSAIFHRSPRLAFDPTFPGKVVDENSAQ